MASELTELEAAIQKQVTADGGGTVTCFIVMAVSASVEDIDANTTTYQFYSPEAPIHSLIGLHQLMQFRLVRMMQEGGGGWL